MKKEIHIANPGKKKKKISQSINQVLRWGGHL